MNKFYILLVFFIYTSISATAQTLSVPAEIKITYDYSFKKDSTISSYQNDRMELYVGGGLSLFRSALTAARDSARRSLLDQGYDPQSAVYELSDWPKGSSWYVYKEWKSRNATYFNEFSGITYKSDDNISAPVWNITTDTMTIHGYLCTKATTEFLGRKWTAWYTPDIPVPDGPWLLWGLPGAIMQAEDENSYFIFKTAGLKVFDIPETHTLPHERSKLRNASFSRILRLERLAAENSTALIELIYGVTVTSSQPVTARPYLPIAIISRK